MTARFLILAAALSAITFVSLRAAPALACKCAPQPVADALGDAEAVFEGRVVTIEDAGEPGMPKKRVTLSIVRVWKSLEDMETVSVTTNAESAACGFAFQSGQSYLVYANRSDQTLGVSSCSRTRPMSDASEDLATLGGGVTPVRVAPPAAPTPSETKSTETKQPPKSRGCSVGEGSAGASSAYGFCALALLGLLAQRRRARLPQR